MNVTAVKVFDYRGATWYRDGLAWNSILIIFGYDCCHIHILQNEVVSGAKITLRNGNIIELVGEMELPVSVGNILEQQLSTLMSLHSQLETTRETLTKDVMSCGTEIEIQEFIQTQLDRS